MSFRCRYCGKYHNSKKDLHSIKQGSQTLYFCSEDEFKLWLKELNLENKFKDDMRFLFDINFTIISDASWRAIDKCVEELRKNYSREEVGYFIEEYMPTLCHIINKKSFDNEYGMVKYMSAVLVNNIVAFLKNNPLPKETKSEATDFYMAPVKYKPSNQRRAMALIETMEDDEENG